MKKTSLIHLIITCLLLITLAVATTFAFFDQENRLSVSENRRLVELPEFSFTALFSGHYTVELEKFLSDHTLYRKYLISIANSVEKLIQRPSYIQIIRK